MDHDIENTSCKDFLFRLKFCINNKNFSITVDAIKQLKAMVNNTSNDLENKKIKFYYGENYTLYTTVNDYKQKIKEEILEEKDECFELYNVVVNEIFGGDIDE